MHFSYDEIEYEVIMVLAGVRAIEKGTARTQPELGDAFVGV